MTRQVVLALCASVALAAPPRSAHAQRIEVTPFGGYRVGGSIAEVDAGEVVDDDGGPSLGVIVDVVFGGLSDGLKVEGVFSRETTDLEVRTGIFDPPASVRVEVDQLQVGGVQDLSYGRVRPFLAGLLGITRYAVPGDTEVRFSLGVGAGVKFYATRNLGLRLDARGYMTVIDLGGSGICGGFGCAIRFNVSPAFQGDFTAGLLLAF
jgi:opacity protein-like surface antigen